MGPEMLFLFLRFLDDQRSAKSNLRRAAVEKVLANVLRESKRNSSETENIIFSSLSSFWPLWN